MDPDKVENEIKENTKLEIPLITAALVIALAIPVATPIVLVAAPVTLIAVPAALVTAFTTPATTLAFTKTAIFTLLN